MKKGIQPTADDIPLLSQWIKKSRSEERDLLVRVMGLEPIRRGHTPLKRACLPIPAHSHLRRLYYGARLLYHFGTLLSTKKIIIF